ncbi:MAG: phage portal protein [Oscillospiraceae bacterium]|nr:phage portal protein [Oscillospiraceae bacterium]
MNIIKKRNIFNTIFGRKPKKEPEHLSNVQMLNTYKNSISNYNGEFYDNEVVRTCIDTIARHFAKMKPEHRLKNSIVKSNLNRLLDYRPNSLMSTYDFLYKVVSNLYINNNSYIYIQRDDFGSVKALHPIDYNNVTAMCDEQGNYFLHFQFNNKYITVPADDIITIRRHFHNNTFFGESNHSTLYPVVNLLHTIDEGTVTAVKMSAQIKGVLKLKGMLHENDRKEKRNTFIKDILAANRSGGVAVVDETAEYLNINSVPLVVNDDVASSAKLKIYNYFGLNEKIITSAFSDTEYQAFYEAVLEPLALQFSQEFTAKLFTQRELEHGNEIIFVADRLSYLSTMSKVRMFSALKELGIISKGTTANIFNLPPPPDADKFLQSLNYINAEKADQYQIGENNEGGETSENE